MHVPFAGEPLAFIRVEHLRVSEGRVGSPAAEQTSRVGTDPGDTPINSTNGAVFGADQYFNIKNLDKMSISQTVEDEASAMPVDATPRLL